MRVRVDAALCTGHGRCYELAPGVFADDGEGYNAAAGTEIDIADTEVARKAIASCPERAITVVGE